MTLEKALETMRVRLVIWNQAEESKKQSFLQKQEIAIPVHLQTGAITKETAALKLKAIKFLREN